MADQPVAPSASSALTPYLSIDGAAKAVELYKKAFGAEVVAIQPPDEKGRLMHAHLHIHGASLMMSDFYPEHGHPPVPHQGFNILITTDKIDDDYKRAVEAGCTATMPPKDMFWGDRYGQLKDPFGVTWAMTQPGAAQ